jgi:hypothetical protein
MKKQILLLLMITFVLILIFILDPNVNENTNSRFIYMNTKISPGDAEGWRNLMKKIGGEKTYEEFAESVKGLREETQHDFVHIFGSVLYEEEGLKGLAVCDSRFFYGCFHEFVGRATQEEGLTSAQKLNDICVDGFTGDEMQSCQHGIGHGIQTLYGYTQEDLNKALEECDNLSYNNILGGGCYGGIFMEFNLRTMLSNEGRVRESENFLSPCDEIDSKYQEACIYWQPQWWRMDSLWSVINPVVVYEKMGNYCRDSSKILGNSSKRSDTILNSCIGGVGGISAPESQFNIPLMRELCDAASKTELESIICKANAGYRATDTLKTTDAVYVCNDLSGISFEYCEAFVLSNYDKLPDLWNALNI